MPKYNIAIKNSYHNDVQELITYFIGQSPKEVQFRHFENDNYCFLFITKKINGINKDLNIVISYEEEKPLFSEILYLSENLSDLAYCIQDSSDLDIKNYQNLFFLCRKIDLKKENVDLFLKENNNIESVIQKSTIAKIAKKEVNSYKEDYFASERILLSPKKQNPMDLKATQLIFGIEKQILKPLAEDLCLLTGYPNYNTYYEKNLNNGPDKARIVLYRTKEDIKALNIFIVCSDNDIKLSYALKKENQFISTPFPKKVIDLIHVIS